MKKIVTLSAVLFLSVLTGCATQPPAKSTGSSNILTNATSTYRPAYRPSGWTYVVTGVSDSHHYIDFSTIKANGNIRSVWEKVNYGSRGSQGDLSVRALMMYDCANRTYVYSQVTGFSGRDLTGNVLGTEKNSYVTRSDVHHIGPDSVIEAKWQTVCRA
jgi:hypothetical protein